MEEEEEEEDDDDDDGDDDDDAVQPCTLHVEKDASTYHSEK